jgi:hypothetical protein
MKISRQVNEVLLFFEYLDHTRFLEKFSQVSENFKRYDASRQNLFSNFVDLIRLAYLPWLILQPSVASTMIFYEFPHEPLALLSEHFGREKLSSIFIKEKFLNDATHIHLTAITINYHDGNSGYNPLLPRAFFGGNPSVDGILGHNLLLSQAFSVGIPSWMGF